MLTVFLSLVTVLSWDYGIKLMFEGLSFAWMGVVLLEIAKRGAKSRSESLTSIFVEHLRNGVLKTPHGFLKTPHGLKTANAILILFICSLVSVYVVLPPLRFDVQVQGLANADMEPIQLSLNCEPNKVDTNASGYATVKLIGLNRGHVDFLGAYASNKKVLLENQRVSTWFVWRHRFAGLAGPIPLVVSKLPSAKEKAETLYQSSLVLIQREDFAGAISKLDEGLANQELDESQRTKLLKAKELCLLWKSAPGNTKKK